jgi:hypothetical protein
MLRTLTLALALALLAANRPTAADAPIAEIGHVIKASNTLLIRDRHLSEARAGDAVLSADVLTSKSDGGFILQLADGSRIATGVATELRVATHNPATQQTLVELLHGTLRADVVTVTKPGGTFAIRTPTAYIAALGTVIGVTAVDTASANLADTLSQQNLDNLPMKGRDFSSLIQLEPGSTPGSGSDPTIGNYNSAGVTLVEGFDHVSSVHSSFDSIPGLVFPLPGEFTYVNVGAPPATPKEMFRSDTWQPTPEWMGYIQKMRELRITQPTGGASPSSSFLAPMDTSPCRAGYSLTKDPLWFWGSYPNGAPPSTLPFSYEVTGNGFSTGLSLTIKITTNSPCTVEIFIPSGTMFHPKGFVGHAVTGMLLGGNPSLKDFQRMTEFGILIVIRPSSSPAGADEPSSGSATVPLRSFCVDLHKLAPHQKTEYRVANPGEQEKFAPDQRIIGQTIHMLQSGQIHAGSLSVDGIIQWSLWVRIEKLKEKEFKEEMTKIAHKNVEAQKKKWDKQTEKAVEASANDLWHIVDTILRAAYSS